MVNSPLPDGEDKYQEALLWFVIVPIAAVVATFTASMIYVQNNPGAPWQLEAAYSQVQESPLSIVAGSSTNISQVDQVYISQEDVEYLNRIYRELNTKKGDNVGETGFCINLVSDQISIQKAGTLEASETGTRFTMDNCVFPGGVNGILHFHPPFSEPVLSGPTTSVHSEINDKEEFLKSPNLVISCVQAGLATTKPGDVTEALRCYKKPPSGVVSDEFPEVAVKVQE